MRTPDAQPARPRRFEVWAAIALALWAWAPAAAADPPAPLLKHRWVYLTGGFDAESTQRNLALLERAFKAGYNGMVSTACNIDWDNLPPDTLANARRIRRRCRDLGMKFIVATTMNTTTEVFASAPDLAESLPVIEAPYRVRGGRILPAETPPPLLNGSFETFRGHAPEGWSSYTFGTYAFIDTNTASDGRACLRISGPDPGAVSPGTGLYQIVRVHPYRQYRLSAMVRTDRFASPDFGIRLQMPPGQYNMHYNPQVRPSQDWERIALTFNSLNATEVKVMLDCFHHTGRLWWDDIRIEPEGPVNIVRRPSTPLVIADREGRRVYTEGGDYLKFIDRLLGNDPYPGGFTSWHAVPDLLAVDSGALREGQDLKVSYHHAAIIDRTRAYACLSEPKLIQLYHWALQKQRELLEPDAYFMQHDEIRCIGWDPACIHRRLSAGQILADHVRLCAAVVRAVDPGKDIYVWSDMFDPTHNAAANRYYYLVRGRGSLEGSWNGLDRDIGILNWQRAPGARGRSIAFFAGRGHRQILVGYCDEPASQTAGWLREVRQVGGVEGVMYTTWKDDYSQLESFLADMNRAAGR